MGKTRAIFQIAGIAASLIEELKRLVRYSMPLGPRCFKCKDIKPGYLQSRSVVVAVDISKAFDTVDITLLLDLISSSEPHPNLVRWLVSYLRGRSASCIHHGIKSKF